MLGAASGGAARLVGDGSSFFLSNREIVMGNTWESHGNMAVLMEIEWEVDDQLKSGIPKIYCQSWNRKF